MTETIGTNLKRMLLIQHPFFLPMIFRRLHLIYFNTIHPDRNLSGSPALFKKITITFYNKQDNANFLILLAFILLLVWKNFSHTFLNTSILWILRKKTSHRKRLLEIPY